MEDDKWHSIDETARHYNCSTKTMQRYIKIGFPAFQIGRKLMFDYDRIDEWIVKTKSKKQATLKS